ncbi:MAG TPA: ribosome silencing factor [Bacteroidales bacterium]|jgi:ribosome-associated protein|nr:ribosome silencing factor [Bacteroidales bacterium]
MVKKKSDLKTNTKEIVSAAIEGILKIKGKDPVSLDLTEIENAVCKYFIICHGDSNTQVDALANSVIETVREETGEKVWHKEGLNNATWVLLDYSDVVVHIFQKEYRDFYKLEELWADAKITQYDDIK